MRIGEVLPGSIVVLAERPGRLTFLLVGSQLGPKGTKRKPSPPYATLVHAVDDETTLPRLEVEHVRLVPPLTEVELVAPGDLLRAMRRRPFHLGRPNGEPDTWTDPLVKGRLEAGEDEGLAF